MWPIFASCGGSFFGLRKDGGSFQPVDEWRPPFIRAFSRLAELGQGPMGRALLRPDLGRDAAAEIFLSGKAPFLAASSRVLWDLKEAARARDEDPFDVIDVAAVPPLGEHAATPMVTVYGAFICRTGANKRVAEDFVTTFLARTTTGERLNRVTPRPPVQLQAMANVKDSDPWVRPYIELCEDGLLMPTFPEMDRLWAVLGAAQFQVLSPGGDNPTKVAADAADQGWELIRQYQRA
jgi:arabinogalactan oligomer/maltooligosaccharide transport system substrate-binding protein